MRRWGAVRGAGARDGHANHPNPNTNHHDNDASHIDTEPDDHTPNPDRRPIQRHRRLRSCDVRKGITCMHKHGARRTTTPA
jgi:hypothetical protein